MSRTGNSLIVFLSFFIFFVKYWFNSVILITYMMFAVIMLVNLLVAMFATTYSECTEQAELIWKFKRLEFYQEN